MSLPVPADGQPCCKLQDMLATYFQNEQHSLRCVRCGIIATHTLRKKLLFWPPSLILHINRAAENGHLDVDIPTSLDARECPSVYRLRSVVARSVLSAESSHYTCYALDENDTWTNYSDARVSSHYGRERPQSLGRDAHILFYALDQDEEAQCALAMSRSRAQYALALSTKMLTPATQEDEEAQYALALRISTEQKQSEGKLVMKGNASDVYGCCMGLAQAGKTWGR